MTVFFLVILLLVNVALLGLGALLFRRLSQASSQEDSLIRLARQAESLHQTLSQQFGAATVDMATRLESTKGDLRQRSDRPADPGIQRNPQFGRSSVDRRTAGADSRFARGAYRADHFAGADDVSAQGRI